MWGIQVKKSAYWTWIKNYKVCLLTPAPLDEAAYKNDAKTYYVSG